MTETLIQVTKLMQLKQWTQAVKLLDQILARYCSDNETIAFLWKRVQCNYELKKHECIIKDCKHLLHLIRYDDPYVGIRARYMLVWALLKTNKIIELKKACEEWLGASCKPPAGSDPEKVLKKLQSMVRTTPMTKKYMKNLSSLVEETLRTWVFSFCSVENCVSPLDASDHLDKMKIAEDPNTTNMWKVTHSPTSNHSQMTENHNKIGEDGWKWRLPPRGFTSETYSLCESFIVRGYCRYGAQCVEAHSNEELAEWRQRFDDRKKEMEVTTQDNKGKTYTEQILEKLLQANSPNELLKDGIEGVEDLGTDELKTTVSSKTSEKDWTFVFRSRRNLSGVAMLQDAHRDHFFIKDIFHGVNKNNSQLEMANGASNKELCQEWVSVISKSNGLVQVNSQHFFEHKVIIGFKTQIYGTFRQSVIFDFGTEHYLVKHLCVDVIPVDNEKMQEIYKEVSISSKERWDNSNSNIVPFCSPIYPDLTTPQAPGEGTREQALEHKYQRPNITTLALSPSTVNDKHVDQEFYRSRMHELLYVEELARVEQVARYNVFCSLLAARSYLLTPANAAASTAKYAHDGELFAVMTLKREISEDTSAGRLILNNCATVLIGPQRQYGDTSPLCVYEALIEDKGKNKVYLRLPKSAVVGLGIIADAEYKAEIQFQLNRLTFCEWHYAIDQIADLKTIFPSTYPVPDIPWSPDKQWNDLLDIKMNSKQKEAVVAITTPLDRILPPILLIGPFGTGKTYTIAQAIRQLLLQDNSRILICTHSNSAADLYIKDFLHTWYEEGLKEAKPLRIYYHKRWVATVNQIVQKYCLIETGNGIRSFRLPTAEDLMSSRIIVVTLSISMYLATLGLPKGFFTHIFLDEAAQAMESEALMPLALATPHSRIVLAGDHMQLSPEVFSKFAEERNLQVSLLERLYEHYPATFPCKILLCENYRAHQAIVDFTSELFYEQKLVASGRQPRHAKFYPLTFFTTRGEDIQDINSTAYYNLSEVYEISERISELKRNWPEAWGKQDDNSIGVMTPYADQVFRIRSELRKRRMGGISVERVLNVQGKEFRAVFLSTVRTRRTCAHAHADYGFLSDLKLLNTAITRARSLVAVVGDPLALCSVGRCRKLWERFIQICHDNDSLFGMTWTLLKSQLDGVELKKSFVLNPLAPEFVPRNFKVEKFQQAPQQPTQQQQQMPMFYPQPMTSIFPNGTNIMHCFPPPPQRTIPDNYRFRPPFIGPLSSSYSIPVIPMRHPQEQMYTNLRPPAEEQRHIVPPEDTYRPFMNVPSSPKLNENVAFYPAIRPAETMSRLDTTAVSVPERVYRPRSDIPVVLRNTDNSHLAAFRALESQQMAFRPNLASNGLSSNETLPINSTRNSVICEVKPFSTHQPPPDDPLKRIFENGTSHPPPMLYEPLSRPLYNEVAAQKPGLPNNMVARSKLSIWLEPNREDIQFLQNVHFPDRANSPVGAAGVAGGAGPVGRGFEEKCFASTMSAMLREVAEAEVGRGAQRGAGAPLPLYARAPRSAPAAAYPSTSYR